MNRLSTLLITSLLLTGCTRQHHMTWPGVHVQGRSTYAKSRAATYDRVSWSANTYEDAAAPGFSFRTPDGDLLTPDSMTIEIMDAHGATEKFYEKGAGRSFDFGNGWMTAYFDNAGQLESVAVVLSRILVKEDPSRTIHIGNREGTRWVSFPAKREDLIELFGEPEREWDYIPRYG